MPPLLTYEVFSHIFSLYILLIPSYWTLLFVLFRFTFLFGTRYSAGGLRRVFTVLLLGVVENLVDIFRVGSPEEKDMGSPSAGGLI